MSSSSKYSGVARYELETRLFAAEHELEKMRELTGAAQRLVDGYLMAPSYRGLPNGTGGPQAIATRERALLEFERATHEHTLTWRQVLRQSMTDAFAETSRDKLIAAVEHTTVVCIQWLAALEDRSTP